MIKWKSYTNLEQSKRLKKILPLSSADMAWYSSYAKEGYSIRMLNDSYPLDIIGEEHDDIPAWSLAALLSIIERECYLTLFHDGVAWNINVISHDATLANLPNHHYNADGNTPLDACYEMIIKLHEQNLL